MLAGNYNRWLRVFNKEHSMPDVVSDAVAATLDCVNYTWHAVYMAILNMVSKNRLGLIEVDLWNAPVPYLPLAPAMENSSGFVTHASYTHPYCGRHICTGCVQPTNSNQGTLAVPKHSCCGVHISYSFTLLM